NRRRRAAMAGRSAGGRHGRSQYRRIGAGPRRLRRRRHDRRVPRRQSRSRRRYDLAERRGRGAHGEATGGLRFLALRERTSLAGSGEPRRPRRARSPRRRQHALALGSLWRSPPPRAHAGTMTPMARDFRLPDLGEGLTEAEIVKVLVHEGEDIHEDTPLLEVETDKAQVEIPSPMSGRVETIHVRPGQTVKVGDVLVSFGEAAGPDGGAPRAPVAAGAARGEVAEASDVGIVGRAARAVDTAEPP